MYDPANNSWTTQAPIPIACFSPAAAVDTNGLIYLFGGVNAGSVVIPNVQVYDPVRNTWAVGANLPIATARLAAASAPRLEANFTSSVG